MADEKDSLESAFETKQIDIKSLSRDEKIALVKKFREGGALTDRPKEAFEKAGIPAPPKLEELEKGLQLTMGNPVAQDPAMAGATPEEIARVSALQNERIADEVNIGSPEGGGGFLNTLAGTPLDIAGDMATTGGGTFGAFKGAAIGAVAPPPMNLLTIPLGFFAGGAIGGAATEQAVAPIKEVIRGNLPADKINEYSNAAILDRVRNVNNNPFSLDGLLESVPELVFPEDLFSSDQIKERAEEGAIKGLVGALINKGFQQIPTLVTKSQAFKDRAAVSFAKFFGVKTTKQLDDTTVKAVKSVMDDGFFDYAGSVSKEANRVKDLVKRMPDSKVKMKVLQSVEAKKAKELVDDRITFYSGLLDDALKEGDQAVQSGNVFQIDWKGIRTKVAEEVTEGSNQKTAFKVLDELQDEWANSAQNFTAASDIKRKLYAKINFNSSSEAAGALARRQAARGFKEAIEDNYSKMIRRSDSTAIVKQVNEKLSGYLEVSPYIDGQVAVERFWPAWRRYLKATQTPEARSVGLVGAGIGGAAGNSLEAGLVGGSIGSGSVAMLDSQVGRMTAGQVRKSIADGLMSLSRHAPDLLKNSSTARNFTSIATAVGLLNLTGDAAAQPLNAEALGEASLKEFKKLTPREQQQMVSQVASLVPDIFEEPPPHFQGIASVVQVDEETLIVTNPSDVQRLKQQTVESFMSGQIDSIKYADILEGLSNGGRIKITPEENIADIDEVEAVEEETPEKVGASYLDEEPESVASQQARNLEAAGL